MGLSFLHSSFVEKYYQDIYNDELKNWYKKAFRIALYILFFREKTSLTGLCGILGICNGPEDRSRNLEEPYPSKSQAYPYSDIPFAESQVQSIVVAPPTKVYIGNI